MAAVLYAAVVFAAVSLGFLLGRADRDDQRATPAAIAPNTVARLEIQL